MPPQNSRAATRGGAILTPGPICTNSYDMQGDPTQRVGLVRPSARLGTAWFLFMLVMMGGACAWANPLPPHCDDAPLRDALRAVGPVVSVGASTSGGLLAKSFPQLAANQLCLAPGEGFASRHTVSSASKFSFLKKVFIEQRPKVVIAMDHLHHSSKGRRFDAQTRRYLDAEIAMLTLDCEHPLIDCSANGDFHFVKRDNYRPIVLLGDVHAFYAVDCRHTDPYANRDPADPNVGCMEDYERINDYLQQKARANPNLLIFPVDRFYRDLHGGLPFYYDINGEASGFYVSDLFWDGYHPRSEPGAQVLANLILQRLNSLIARGALRSSVSIPYIPIAAKHFKPFTGLVLINDSNTTPPPSQTIQLRRADGGTHDLPFAKAANAPRANPGEWLRLPALERSARSLINRVGAHPLVLRIDAWSESGEIVLNAEQAALLEKVLTNPKHQLRGGALITRE